MGKEKMGVCGYDNVGMGWWEVLEEGWGRVELLLIGIVRVGERGY